MKSFALLIPAALMIAACAAPSDGTGDGFGTGVVYGDDSRREPNAKADHPAVRAATQASGAIIRLSHIKKVNSKTWKVLGKPVGVQRNLCADARFVKQMSASFCSGALIGPDRFLTAGHCVESGCDDFKVVFGWTAANGANVGAANVYGCKNIVKMELSDDVNAPDMAIIQLDRKVSGRQPAQVSFEPMKQDEELLLVGHPSGLPQKYSKAKVRTPASVGVNYAKATSDTFSGDSGCPVFGDNGKIKGVLIGGEEDYVYDEKRGCYKVNVCAENECRGEDVLQLKPELLDENVPSSSSRPAIPEGAI